MSEAGAAAGCAPTGRLEATAALGRVLELSLQVLAASESGEAALVISLDAERRRLLQSVRATLIPMNDEDRTVLAQIADLNDRSLGRMEHRLRAKCRDMDMLFAGRRAVRAYGNTRS